MTHSASYKSIKRAGRLCVWCCGSHYSHVIKLHSHGARSHPHSNWRGKILTLVKGLIYYLYGDHIVDTCKLHLMVRNEASCQRVWPTKKIKNWFENQTVVWMQCVHEIEDKPVNSESAARRLAFQCWLPPIPFHASFCWMRIERVQWASEHCLGSKAGPRRPFKCSNCALARWTRSICQIQRYHVTNWELGNRVNTECYTTGLELEFWIEISLCDSNLHIHTGQSTPSLAWSVTRIIILILLSCENTLTYVHVHCTALLWQKEASDKIKISCKRAKCVRHFHWRQWNIMMSYVTYLLARWVFMHLDLAWKKSTLGKIQKHQ